MENYIIKKAKDSITGNKRALEALRELIIYPFINDHMARKIGLKWPKGLLLYGPPGTGKTSLAEAVVRESGAHLTKISTYSVYRAHAGKSEKFLRESFAQAYSYGSSGKPSVIFIDEIDAICPYRDNRKERESRIVGQLLILMDGNNSSSKPLPHVVIVASTNRIDVIDPALRRPGRFDTEIEVSVPTAKERLEILKLYSRNVKLDQKVNLQAIAQSCNGYVGADLKALCREAARLAYCRTSSEATASEVLSLKMEDCEDAKFEVGSSITRGVTKEFSKISWDDIGGLKDLKVRNLELHYRCLKFITKLMHEC